MNITRGAMTVLNRAAPSYSGSVLVIYITLPTSGNTYIFPGSTAEKLGLTGAGKQAILDTGTTLNHVPTKLAKTYNAQYRVQGFKPLLSSWRMRIRTTSPATRPCPSSKSLSGGRRLRWMPRTRSCLRARTKRGRRCASLVHRMTATPGFQRRQEHEHAHPAEGMLSFSLSFGLSGRFLRIVL